jgi:hypothetical protein
MKSDFTAKVLQQKFTLMSSKYKELTKACKVGRHELRGKTGSAAVEQATTPKEAIDLATKVASFSGMAYHVWGGAAFT